MHQHFKDGARAFFAARKERAGYHHGNLKETLLDAAEALIAERGPAGITLSEMARMAGVSNAAIYRHYADLGALIGAVAQRGFQEFSTRLRMASAAAGPGVSGFKSMGDAYLAFARSRPGAYAAMFSSPLQHTGTEVAQAGEVAFNTLLTGLAEALSAQGISGGAAFSLAIKIWSLAHGIATLTASGRLSPAIGATPESMLREGVQALMADAARQQRT